MEKSPTSDAVADPPQTDAPRVFVTRTLPGTAPLARLRASTRLDLWEHERPPGTEDLARRSADCEGLLTMLTERVDGALLDRCPGVRGHAEVGVAPPYVRKPGLLAVRALAASRTGLASSFLIALFLVRRTRNGFRRATSARFRPPAARRAACSISCRAGTRSRCCFASSPT